MSTRSKNLDWTVAAICAVLAILVFAVFGQTLRYDFVNYDDSWYVYQNIEITRELTVGGIARAFMRKEMGLWTPLVTASHMLDCRLYGLRPGLHHLTNVLLHLASAILLFLVLRKMTGALWRSAFVAAVFAIHPLKVESVAWVSERKDVLSGLFFMLTLTAYVRHVRQPGSISRYLLVVILFALGLMCKPMLVTLPFVLMLLDYWPLNRLLVERGEPSKQRLINWRAVAEKIPLLALSLGLCAVLLHGAGDTASIGVKTIPFWARMEEAPVWVVTYLWQMIWPAEMAVIYAHPEASLPWWPAALVLCMAISGGAFLLRNKHPYLWMGWLWNVGMLVPVIGFVQISRHARADHYTYLPQIGLSMALTWIVADRVGQRRHGGLVAWSVAAAILCVLSAVAWHQTSYWRDNNTLWTHAKECTQDNFFANYKLGETLRLQGKIDDAVVQYRKALRINPEFLEAHYNLGNALRQQGRTEDAITQYREALRINPVSVEALNNLGNSLLQQGKMQEAIIQYREALRINPKYEDAGNNLGSALLQQGRTVEAISQYREILKYYPDSLAGHYNLGLALARHGRMEEAIAEYHESLRINPDCFEAHYSLGVALRQQGWLGEAIAEYREALRINPAAAVADELRKEINLYEINGRFEKVE